jgi:hypothetical protein
MRHAIPNASPQGVQGVRDARVVHLVRAGTGKRGNEFHIGKVAVPVAQAGWSVDQQRPNLTPRRLLGLHRRASRHGQRPQRLDARPLGVGGGLPDRTDGAAR